jgi:hypothetical protein
MTRLIIAITLALLGLTAQSSEQYYSLGLEEWSLPRSGEAITRFPAVRSAVRALEISPGSQIQLRYPGGEEGSLWAQELSDWLISLGIDPEAIHSVPGSPFNDQLEMVLIGVGGAE